VNVHVYQVGLLTKKSLFTSSLFSLSFSYLSICIPPSRNPPSRLLRQFEFLNIKNSSAFCNYDRMTGRQEYDRTKDRQRILDEYMIDKWVLAARARPCAARTRLLGLITMPNRALRAPRPSQLRCFLYTPKTFP
jgi:hypothetical protein